MTGCLEIVALGCGGILIIIAGIFWMILGLLNVLWKWGSDLIGGIWRIIAYLLGSADIFYSSGWGLVLYGLGFIFILSGIILSSNPSEEAKEKEQRAIQLSAILDKLSKIGDR